VCVICTHTVYIHIQTHEGDKTSYTMSTQEPVPLYTFQGRVWPLPTLDTISHCIIWIFETPSGGGWTATMYP